MQLEAPVHALAPDESLFCPDLIDAVCGNSEDVFTEHDKVGTAAGSQLTQARKAADFRRVLCIKNDL